VHSFIHTFTNCDNSVLSPEARDVTFRMIHGVLPVNMFLYRLNIVKSPTCSFCNALCETLPHLFFTCETVKPFWKFIQDLFIKFNENIEIKENLVIFNIFEQSIAHILNNLVAIIISEARWAIWFSRNLKKFEEKSVNSNFIQCIFLANIKLRIKSDFLRMGPKFSRLWCHREVFCKLVDEKPHLLV